MCFFFGQTHRGHAVFCFAVSHRSSQTRSITGAPWHFEPHLSDGLLREAPAVESAQQTLDPLHLTMGQSGSWSGGNSPDVVQSLRQGSQFKRCDCTTSCTFRVGGLKSSKPTRGTAPGWFDAESKAGGLGQTLPPLLLAPPPGWHFLAFFPVFDYDTQIWAFGFAAWKRKQIGAFLTAVLRLPDVPLGWSCVRRCRGWGVDWSTNRARRGAHPDPAHLSPSGGTQRRHRRFLHTKWPDQAHEKNLHVM